MKNLNQHFLNYVFLAFCSITPIGCDIVEEPQNVSSKIQDDPVCDWLNKSKNESLLPQEKRQALLKAYELNEKRPRDTVKMKNLRSIAFQAAKLNDSITFRRANNESYSLSKAMKDTLGIADAHWNYGIFYSNKEVYDSAYSHYRSALTYYRALGNDFYSGKMLYNMAFIKGRLKDYTGSEVLTFQAISNYEKLDKYKSLYTSYKYLAVIYKELEEYDRAFYYNNVALNYLEKVDNKETYYVGTLNNIGLIYHKQRKFDEAIKYFNKALEVDSIKSKNIELYARLIDNRAHSKLYNNDTVGLLYEFNESLYIRDSLKNLAGIALNKLHIAEYYRKQGDTSQSIHFSKAAMSLSKEIENYSDYLASLKLLSQIDTDNAHEYLNEYVQVNDSLQSVERKIRNKFTRIDFETDQYIEETERLYQEKILLVAVSVCLVLIFALLYFNSRQYASGKKLLFESEQQKANEKIYLLTLEQQAKLQEGKTQERNRISEELHDGVLSKLFGTRVGLGFLVPSLNKEGSEKYKRFMDELQNIEKEIRDISHELKDYQVYTPSTGFFALITKIIKVNSEIGRFEYKLIKDETILWDDVNDIVKTNLHRIIQESLQNIVKYAHATEVVIVFMIKEGKLHLTIKDNGVGFKAGKRKTGIGLKNLKSRAEKLNGEFFIESVLQKGTEITIRIPTNSFN